jgi:phosphate transport system protein
MSLADSAEGLTMAEETRRPFHAQLDDVKSSVVELGVLVLDRIPRATRILLDFDLQGAQTLIDEDDQLDVLSLAIEEECLRLLALQQPMASDLRAVMTANKLNWDLERAGDLAVNIAKATRRMFGLPVDAAIPRLIESMSEEAARLVRLALDAYIEGNAPLAAALDDIDDRLDGLQLEFIERLIESYDNDVIPISSVVNLSLIARYYERIGDHAVNVGERVRYLVTGWMPEHTGAARDRARRARADNEG